MKPKILYLLFLFIIINSCHLDPYGSNPCPAYQTQYHYLSAAAINKTPYFTNPAFDTISFSSDKGDTITFYKIKTDSSWYCLDDNGNPNCPKEKANCYQNLFKSYSPKIAGTGYSITHILTKYEVSNLVSIDFNEFHFAVNDYTIGDKKISTYMDSISFGNNKFYNVFKLI